MNGCAAPCAQTSVLRSTSGDVVANALVCVDTAFTTGRICRETDGNGRYAITTRAETYIITFDAPPNSGLGRIVLPNISVSAATETATGITVLP